MTDKLKPCPFCGGSYATTEIAYKGFSVLCRLCLSAGPTERWKDGAEDAWNRRVTPPGYVLVPEEPTKVMLDVAVEQQWANPGAFAKCWRIMINAAKGEQTDD